MIKNQVLTKKDSNLKDCLGTIKKDEEWKEIKKDLKKGWKKRNNRYNS